MPAAPAPRNLATPPTLCLAGTDPSIILPDVAGEAAQIGPIVVTAIVTPGTNPTSSTLVVTADLSTLGGTALQTLTDDGVDPDAVASDNVFTTSFFVDPTLSAGAYSFSARVADDLMRSATDSATLTLTLPPVEYLPHQIQGSDSLSSLAGQLVAVQGVVTARKFNGFFLQTPVFLEDGDPNTSEGLFVFVSGGAPDSVIVGNLARVNGTVAEFSPSSDPDSPPLTELSAVTSITDLGDAGGMPPAVGLTSAELSPSGTLDQLERFEGMRVTVASLTAVSGTGGFKNEAAATSLSDGAFYAVLSTEARPFREPGIAIDQPQPACAAATCVIPLFDGNPERLRVDTDALENRPALNVSSGTSFADVTGPLDFSARTYTILPEADLTPTGGITLQSVPVAGAGQFTIASFNIERFYDSINDPGGDVALTPAALQTRLAKASLTIRAVLNNPDVIGLQEVENIDVLQLLADRIDADAGPAAAPHYAPYLVEGNDPGGIDVAFLVKTAGGRVSVDSTEQIGAAATFVNPNTGLDELLNDRPPLVGRFSVASAPGRLPQTVTVIVNHLRSLIDAELDNESGQRVRAKRRAQAEFLANYIQSRQAADPNEAIVSIGDYNAFRFNDGYVDSIGTILGTPTAEDQVVLASLAITFPNLVNAADLLPAENYSYVFGGNAQTLDHVILTGNLVPQFAALEHARVNADFAEVLRGDATSPSRVSDHDPVVAYFELPRDQVAPEFTSAAPNLQAVAVTGAGVAVSFATPSATDNLDGEVNASCLPASGSVFPLGTTTVTCTAQDFAGNAGTLSFTVTVVDNGNPVVTVPANMSVTAPTSAGTAVTFTATANDAIDPRPQVSCAPPSGSTFAVGTTTVSCTATDASGNSASRSFTVTVTVAPPPPPPPTSQAGHMFGAGEVRDGDDRVTFIFDVRESARQVERGWVVLRINDGKGRPDRYFALNVSDVRFSNSASYKPGSKPKSGVDTVTFSGKGYWNGRANYRFEITATDRGEPGRGRDTFEVVVRTPGGTAVESVSGMLRDGNIQSFR